MSSSDTSNTRPDNVINASPFSCRHLSWAERKLNVKFIHQQPQTADSGGRSEALWLPEWEQEWRPKREECNSASCHPPPTKEVEERNHEREEPDSFLWVPGFRRLSQAPLDTFPPAALGKQTGQCAERRGNLSTLHQQVTRFSKGNIHIMWTSSKDNVSDVCFTWKQLKRSEGANTQTSFHC